MFVLKEKKIKKKQSKYISPLNKTCIKIAKNFTCCFWCSCSAENRSESRTSITFSLVVLILAEALFLYSLWFKPLFNKIRISPNNSKDAKETSKKKRYCIFQFFFWFSWVEEKPILFILPANFSGGTGRVGNMGAGRGQGRKEEVAGGPGWPVAPSRLSGTEGPSWWAI